jgi:hypothetical protein
LLLEFSAGGMVELLDMLPGTPAGGMVELLDMLPGAPGGMVELLDMLPGAPAGGMVPLPGMLSAFPAGGTVALLDTLLALSAEEVVVSDVLLLVHPDIATTDRSSKPITKKLIFFIIVPQKYCLIVTSNLEGI